MYENILKSKPNTFFRHFDSGFLDFFQQMLNDTTAEYKPL